MYRRQKLPAAAHVKGAVGDIDAVRCARKLKL
jgi:hypothetical protein